MKRRRLYLNALAAVGGLASVIVILVVLQKGVTWSAPPVVPQVGAQGANAPAPTVSSLPAVAADVVAVVDGEQIARAEWRRVTAMDRVMSQLAGQPLPDAESTLDRLINERLVLRRAAQDQIAASDAQARERLASLQQNWHADDASVDQALASADLSRQDLLAEIKRLIIVEAYLKQVSATQNPAAWLAAQRSQARIGIYADLAAPAAQTVTPTSVAQTLTPTPTLKPAPTQVALPVGSAPGQLAPDFILDDVTGGQVELYALRGHPVVVNLWATWCPPCRQEMPALQSAYQHYRDQGVVLLGVNVKEDVEAIREFTSQSGLTYPVLLDRDGTVSERYQARGIPTTVFLDAEGIVRARHVGPLTEEQFAQYLAPLLASPAPTPTATTPAAKMAPDFSLSRENGQPVRLSDYRDRSSVVLVFYRGQT